MTVFCAFFTLNNCQYSDCHNQHMGIPLMVIAQTSFTHFKQGGTMAAKTGNRKYQARMGAHDCIKDIWSQEHFVHLQLIALLLYIPHYLSTSSLNRYRLKLVPLVIHFISQTGVCYLLTLLLVNTVTLLHYCILFFSYLILSYEKPH